MKFIVALIGFNDNVLHLKQVELNHPESSWADALWVAFPGYIFPGNTLEEAQESALARDYQFNVIEIT